MAPPPGSGLATLVAVLCYGGYRYHSYGPPGARESAQPSPASTPSSVVDSTMDVVEELLEEHQASPVELEMDSRSLECAVNESEQEPAEEAEVSVAVVDSKFTSETAAPTNGEGEGKSPAPETNQEFSTDALALPLLVIVLPWALVDMLFCWTALRCVKTWCCCRRRPGEAENPQESQMAEGGESEEISKVLQAAAERQAQLSAAAQEQRRAELAAAAQEQRILVEQHRHAVEQHREAELEWEKAFQMFQEERAEAEARHSADIAVWRSRCSQSEEQLSRLSTEAAACSAELEDRVSLVETREKKAREYVQGLEVERQRLREELKAKQVDFVAGVPTPARSNCVADSPVLEEKRRAEELEQQLRDLSSKLRRAEDAKAALEAEQTRTTEALETAQRRAEELAAERSMQPSTAAAAAAAAAATVGAAVGERDAAALGRKRLSDYGARASGVRRGRRASAPAAVAGGSVQDWEDSARPHNTFEQMDQEETTEDRLLSKAQFAHAMRPQPRVDEDLGQEEQAMGPPAQDEAVDPDDLDQLLKERWVADDPYTYAIFEDEEEEREYHKCRSLFLPRALEELHLLRKEKKKLHSMASSFLEDLEKQTARVKGLVGVAVYYCTLSGEDPDHAAEAVEAMLQSGVPTS